MWMKPGVISKGVNDHHKTWNSVREAKHGTKENLKAFPGAMAELCQKLPVIFEIDTEKNGYAEYKLPVGYRIEDIVAYILSELDHLFGMAAWVEPPSLATECQEIFMAAVWIRAPDPGEAFLQVSALQVILDHLINNWTKEAILFLVAFVIVMPFGLDLPVGATHGAGTVVLVDGLKMLEVPLWRSYLAGCILLGIAPCTAMVLVWGYLSRGNDGLTLVMVAINSLTMLVLYGVLGGFLLGIGRLPVPWQALLLSIGIYVALPLVAGYLSRKWIIAAKGKTWFKEKFLQVLTPITIIALLITLVLLFSFKGEDNHQQPADHPVDRHPALYTDRLDFLAGVWSGASAEAPLC